LRASDPTLEQSLQMSGKRLNLGELFSEIIKLTAKNDKIIEDISPEDMEQAQIDPATGQPIDPMQEPIEGEVVAPEQLPQGQPELDPEDEQELVNIQAIAEEYGVSENIASAMREAEMQGAGQKQIMNLAQRLGELEALNYA
ncbi:hypothetical protein KDA08_01010, partial [Candidatus Saccharibacteria bacterium]|nr:hypothetical protein [Candidatus Saccharibacteria bacterium]